jgi:hexosaminidase
VTGAGSGPAPPAGTAGTLRSHYTAGDATISLVVDAAIDLPAGWHLAFTSQAQLTPPTGVALVERLASFHVVDVGRPLAAGDRWHSEGWATSHPCRHANDGPVSAYVVVPTGATVPVTVAPMTTDATVSPTPAAAGRMPARPSERPGLLPHPDLIEPALAGDDVHVVSLALRTGDRVAHDAWSAIATLTPTLTPVHARGGSGEHLTVDAVTARTGHAVDDPAGEGYRIDVGTDAVTVTASGPTGFRHAFVTLAQWARAGLPDQGRVVDRPQYAWRGLHVDLARQWFEPTVVERLIDACAWRKLNRLHLHLTDDEGWRLPVPRRPTLATVAARRGHGRPLPPMLGDGPEGSGRAYTAEEIGRWVGRADRLGVVLVPEVDLPAHAHAALTALPELRDPADRSGAVSVQYFVDNVLAPGLAATDAFVADVVDAVAELFPSSPWIHIGGDEVPAGAWSGSPVVDRLRREHGLDTTPDVEAHFHRGLVATVRARTGRRVGAWQEAAEAGGVRPGDGYVVGWTDAAASRRLAAAGHDVVVAPGEAYYLDMAVDGAWDTPGASWAGATSLADVCAFDPAAGWDAAEREHLLGVQACLWTEHVRDAATLWQRLVPRLDAVAERAWTGRIVGGPDDLAARSAAIRA